MLYEYEEKNYSILKAVVKYNNYHPFYFDFDGLPQSNFHFQNFYMKLSILKENDIVF